MAGRTTKLRRRRTTRQSDRAGRPLGSSNRREGAVRKRSRRRPRSSRRAIARAVQADTSDSEQTEFETEFETESDDDVEEEGEEEEEHEFEQAREEGLERRDRRRRTQLSNPYGFPVHNRADQDDQDRFYVIQELLEKRTDRDGNEEYLVRWQNYPPEYDSWEPRAELEKNSLDMIHEFNRIANGERKLDELHCVCRRPYRFDQGGMILCNNCNGWYHFTCLQMNMAEANSYAKYHCQACRDRNPELKNVIKPEKVSLLFGNTRIVDIENPRMPADDEPFTV